MAERRGARYWFAGHLVMWPLGGDVVLAWGRGFPARVVVCRWWRRLPLAPVEALSRALTTEARDVV